MNDKTLYAYIDGTLPEQMTEEVVNWIEASAENMDYYLSLRKLYDINLWAGKQPKKRTIGRLWREVAKVAAVALISVGGAWLWSNNTNKAAEQTSVQTLNVPAGQRAELTLSDGTKVWLNSNSQLRFPDRFDSRQRNVELVGEGYFEVAHNPDQPFVVNTEQYDIKVFGTTFNVFAYKTSTFETSLIEGSVEVTAHNLTQSVRLQPQSRAYIKDNQLTVGQIMQDDYFSWRDGIISFDHITVNDLLQRLSAYYGIDFSIENQTIAQQRFTGKFRTSDEIEHIIKTLRLKQQFDYTIEGTKITIR